MVNHLGVSKYYHERRDTNFLQYFDFFKIKKKVILPWETIYTCILKKTLDVCIFPGII